MQDFYAGGKKIREYLNKWRTDHEHEMNNLILQMNQLSFNWSIDSI